MASQVHASHALSVAEFARTPGSAQPLPVIDIPLQLTLAVSRHLRSDRQRPAWEMVR